MMNFSGAIKKAYQSKNTSLVFVGDSITWGYGLRYDQTIDYYIQNYLNNSNLYQNEYGSKFTTPTYWGWADNPTDNTGMTITGRNLHMDDLAKHSWSGYGDRVVYQQPIYSPDKSKITTPGFGFYPFSSGLDIDGGISSVAQAAFGNNFYWNNGGLAITSGGKIQFKAKYPSTTGGYILMNMQGVGKFTVTQNDSTTLLTSTVGAIIKGSTTSGSNQITNVTTDGTTYGTVKVGSYILNISAADDNSSPAYYYQFPTYYNTQLANVDTSNPSTLPVDGRAWTGTDPTTGSTVPIDPIRVISISGSTITLNYNAPSTITNGYFYALEPYPKQFEIGPFNSSGGYDTYSINSTGDIPTLISLWPTANRPKIGVQVHGRNSYGIGDYATSYNASGLPTSVSPLNGHTVLQSERNQNLIMRTVFNDQDHQGTTTSPPIYVFALGINNIVPTYNTTPSRQYTPTQYKTALETLVTAFTRSSNYNYGRVVLTVPLIPLAAFTLMSPYTYGDYRKSIIDLAKSKGWSYIDLSRLKLTSADYNITIPGNPTPYNDGLHPGPLGVAKIAKHYINTLEL